MPHTLCACPKPGTYSQVVVIVLNCSLLYSYLSHNFKVNCSCVVVFVGFLKCFKASFIAFKFEACLDFLVSNVWTLASLVSLE